MAQKLAICSDLHIDTYSSGAWYLPQIPHENTTILIMAGDVCECRSIPNFEDFFDDINHRFQHVLYIMGNHEYYGGEYQVTVDVARQSLQEFENITILDNESIQMDNIHFVGSTLWTNILDHDIKFAQGMMSDYRAIKYRGHRLTPQDTSAMHEECVRFIDREIDPLKKTVLITHHMPSYACVHPIYHGNRLNCAFLGNISDRLELLKPVLAIHGHTHTQVDVIEGDTRIICNPRGYPGENDYDYNLKMVSL